MAFPILGSPNPQFFDSSGAPYASGTLSVLEPADDTNKASYPTYDDAEAATNANTNPVVLNARGECSLWGLDGEDYKLVLKDSAAATIWTSDDVFLPTAIPTKYGGTAQTLTDAGAVTLTEGITFLVTTGAAAITLADGVEGQRKIIVMKTDGGAATLTPANFANGTIVTFNDVGDSADLIFANAKWHWIGGTATLSGTADTLITFTSTDATPSVAVGNTFHTSGTTAITDFDDGVVGKTIKIFALAASITITHGAPISLAGTRDFVMLQGDTLTLHMFVDQVWEEIARSTASAAKRSEVVITTNIISLIESGTTFYLDLVGGFTSSLPSPALGLNYKFIVKTAPTTSYIIVTTSGDNILYGTLQDISGEQVYFAAQDTINFVGGVSAIGDSLEVESDGTNWYCRAISGVDSGITTAA